METVKSNVLAFRRHGWSATAGLRAPAARAAGRPQARGMRALVEAAARLDAAVTAPLVDLAELQDELARYRDLFERAPVGFLVMGFDGRIECANRAATAVLSPGRTALTGGYLRDFCASESALEVAGHLARLAHGAAFDLCEINVVRGAEPPLCLRLETLNLRDARQPGPLRTVLLDSAGLDDLEDGLSLAASVVEYTSQAVVVTDADYRTIAVNPAFTTVTGFAAAEVLGQIPGVFLHAGVLGGRDLPLFDQLRDRGYWQGEFANRRKGGDSYMERVQVNAIPDAQGNTKYYVCMLSDASGHDASQSALIALAYRDNLTGLANRASLLEQLGRALIAARRDKHPLGLIYLDLDGFKEVNDSLGHSGGDRLLRFVAERLRAAVRQTDLVARIGGDEFAIVMPNLAVEGAAGRVAASILGQFEATPFREQGRECRVAASIGITLFPKDGTTLETLLNCADSAMYEAKKAGGSRYRFYSPQTSPDFKQHGGLEVALRQALARRLLQVRYQARMRISDLRMVGCEAGVCREHGEHGELGAGALAALAETTGLAIPLEHLLMRMVAADAPGLAGEGPGPLRIGLSLTPLHFDPGNLRHLFRRVARVQAAAPVICELEIPAAVAVSPSEATLETLARLRALGAEITLRGFGSEALSASQLAHLPLTRVKTAPSLIAGLERDPAEGAALKGLIALARALDLPVIADGVETLDQLRVLREAGCDEAQGALFGPPVAAAAIAILWGRAALPAAPVHAGPPPGAIARFAASALRVLSRLRRAFRFGA